MLKCYESIPSPTSKMSSGELIPVEGRCDDCNAPVLFSADDTAKAASSCVFVRDKSGRGHLRGLGMTCTQLVADFDAVTR